MFTGIVHSAVKVDKIEKKSGLWTLSLTLPESLISGLSIGASIALNGTCLTVTSITQCQVTFDVMLASLNLTNLQYLDVGTRVNVERAAKFGDDIGGHQLSGHVHGLVKVVEIERPENNCIVWFELTDTHKPYIFDKGYIGLNGCSLTIAQVKEDRFCVYLIPETLNVTTYQDVKVGDAINLEIDSHTQAVVETVERLLKQKNLA
ncbi:riboflavin synthase [Oceaniserpentilla sp. 4NH20-0058]|uniref:riboflavin synthase subunit alpha n=1 Tax=Oceaniserpentilla sp. 4NH20-0058 TaxID=3127660 RepID=UPI003102E829